MTGQAVVQLLHPLHFVASVMSPHTIQTDPLAWDAVSEPLIGPGYDPSRVVETCQKVLVEVCDTIAKKFLAITDADTGESLVREVVRVHKKYPGENGGDLPDLLIKWVEGRQINAMTSPEIGEIRLDHLPDARTGAHKDYGFFLAVGEGIKHLNGSADEHEVYNWDFAPTALHIMGERTAHGYCRNRHRLPSCHWIEFPESN